MIKVKHFTDAIEPDDGQRLWVEPIGLTLDLRAWCEVHALLTELAPPLQLWTWFQECPDYQPFRGVYHYNLARGPHRRTLQGLAILSMCSDITLLHQGDDPRHNTATALFEFLSELQAYCPPPP